MNLFDDLWNAIVTGLRIDRLAGWLNRQLLRIDRPQWLVRWLSS